MTIATTGRAVDRRRGTDERGTGTGPQLGRDPSTRTSRLNEIGSAQAATIVLGLVSALAWGAGDFGGGLLSRRTALFGVVLVSQLAGAVLALVLALVARRDRADEADLGWSVLAGVAGGIGITALYRGLAVGRMGVVAPVTGVIAALIPVTAGIVLEGLPPPLVLVGIAAAVIAVVLVSRVRDEASGPSGHRAGARRRRGDRPLQRVRGADQRRARLRARWSSCAASRRS